MIDPRATLPRRRLLGGGAAVLLAGALPPAPARAAPSPTVFATDLRLPGLLHAVIVRPPLPGLLLADHDARASSRVRGVVGIVALVPWGQSGLAGLGGVAVLARDTWSALRGRDALAPEWAGIPDARDVPRPAHFVPATAEPLMEPPSATAIVTRDGCAVWIDADRPGPIQTIIADLIGLAKDSVRLHEVRRAGPNRVSNPAYAVEAALLSAAMRGAPVLLTWTQADDAPFRYGPASVA